MTNCKFCNEKVSSSEDTNNDDEHVNCRNEAERRKETIHFVQDILEGNYVMYNMGRKVTIKKDSRANALEIDLSSDSGTTVRSIVFNSCSIKPNPFITKQSDTTSRL